ncbi:MAG: class I mannose-6-phosphate isomerase, partial [Bacteroidales bacterium]|nr:class I mannose-6-phosphate isomerase [Bacteroidales bacterium]
AEEGAKLFSGFTNPITKEEYLDHLEKGTLPGLLNEERPVKGDVFFIPAGCVHAIGEGLILAEIQQTSDITYRIYDWERVGLDGKPRDLHTDLAVDVIDYSAPGNYKTVVDQEPNRPSRLAECKYFTTNIINFNKTITRDYSLIDSFVIYLCTEGSYDLEWDEETMHIEKGETILIPAIMEEIRITSEGATLLEIFINPEYKDNE